MRTLFRALTLVIALFLGGFAVFALNLPSADEGWDDPDLSRLEGFHRTEIGIVALTGGSGKRIERALALFDTGRADRVLISGTHPTVRKQDLTQYGDPDVLACCVDLGPRAQTTVGNAIEARDWAADHDYRGLILVTSDYHLPRALLEVRSVAADSTVVGVPVRGNGVTTETWWQSAKGWQLISSEYVKYLLTVVRAAV